MKLDTVNEELETNIGADLAAYFLPANATMNPPAEAYKICTRFLKFWSYSLTIPALDAYIFFWMQTTNTDIETKVSHK